MATKASVSDGWRDKRGEHSAWKSAHPCQSLCSLLTEQGHVPSVPLGHTLLSQTSLKLGQWLHVWEGSDPGPATAGHSLGTHSLANHSSFLLV